MPNTATAEPAAPVATSNPADALPTPEVLSPDGFVDSIDSFFATPTPEPEAKPDVTPEPKAEPKAKPEPEEPKAEPTGLDDLDDLDADVKDWTPQAARRFRELKAELKVEKARSAELSSKDVQSESRTKELEALASNPEYKELREKVESYEKQLLVSRLEDSSAYRNLVTEPIAKIVSDSDAIAEKYGIDSDALVSALAMNDESAQEERLTELLSEASERDKFKIYKAADDMKPILAQRLELRENAAAAIAEVESLEQERTNAELVTRARDRKDAAIKVMEKIQSKLSFLSDEDGVDFDAIGDAASKIDPTTLDPVEGTYQAIAAKLLPKIASKIFAMQKEMDAMTDKLADYDGLEPKAGSGSPSPHSASKSPTTASFVDAVAAAFGG